MVLKALSLIHLSAALIENRAELYVVEAAPTSQQIVLVAVAGICLSMSITALATHGATLAASVPTCAIFFSASLLPIFWLLCLSAN